MNKKFVRILVPSLCAVLLVVLAFCRMNDSVWFDESYTAYLIRGDFGEIWNLTALDVHPPVYYFLLKIWSLMFGTSAVALRGMSVFFGVIAIFLVFFLVRKLFNDKVASLATIFTTFSPVLIRYTEEMRMYTLVFAIVVAASLVLIYAIESGKKRFWMLYGVLVALGMWTHYFTALAWVAHVVFLGFYYKKDLKKVWQKLLIGYGLAILLFLPWIGIFFRQMVGVSGGFWIAEVTATTMVNYLTMSVIFAEANNIKGWLIVAVIAMLVVVLTLIYKKKHDKRLLLLELLIIVPPLLLLLLSLPPMTPLFVDRYVIYSSVLIWTWLGVNLSCKDWSIATHIVIIVACLGLLNVMTRTPNSDIKELVDKISTQEQSAVKIATSTELIYYDAIAYDNEDIKVYGIDEFYGYEWGSHEPMKKYCYNLVERLDDIMGPKWLILNKDAEIRWNYTDIIELNDHKAIKVI